MTERQFIFRKDKKELILPVTPGSYQVEKGVNIEVVNIHELGDAIFTGYGILATLNIDILLPAGRYPFAADNDPAPYIAQLEAWIEEKSRLRFIVGGTGINLPVVIEHFQYGESDGTKDIYGTLILREYRSLKAVQVKAAPEASQEREAPAAVLSSTVIKYPIVYGDTLSAICRKFYGDGSAATYNKLAAYNQIPNANLIRAGATLQIPQPLP